MEAQRNQPGTCTATLLLFDDSYVNITSYESNSRSVLASESKKNLELQ